MKNDFFSANIDRLYAAAKEKHGERAEEALTDAVRKTAGKFKKLGEKGYVTALLQAVDASAFFEDEEPAPKELTAKLESIFAERVSAAQKKETSLRHPRRCGGCGMPCGVCRFFPPSRGGSFRRDHS